MYDYGLIGNCQISALVSITGSIDWLCLPRPDSPPVFGKILDPDGGQFSICGTDVKESRQRYCPNTNVLVTEVECKDGSRFEITDYCPRFFQHGRTYRPNSLFRKVERKSGNPRLTINCQPVDGWEKTKPRAIRGSSHLSWEIRGEELRLLTNMPLTHLCEETPFNLEEPLHFALTWGLPLEDDLTRISHQFLELTLDYWRTWVKHCSIPALFQKETIRSALALKLHCYEDTGAILAALTTSLPEEHGNGRNWDYRYCWLRDAYFVLSAFRSLGHFEEMEGFLKFLLGIAHHHEHSKDRLRPVYSLDQTLPTPETVHANWAGYKGSKPVRSHNQASEHVQNDVYGEMILTLAPIFLDERFYHLRTPAHEELIGHLAKFCASKISEPDAGLWELRDGWREHSFSNLMCWAGLDRTRKIQKAGYLGILELEVDRCLARSVQAVEAASQNGILGNGPNDPSADAALLQLAILRFPDRVLCERTVAMISDELSLRDHSSHSSFLYRYKRKDDFGTPQSAFLICSFWLVQALGALGKTDEALLAMNETLKASNHLGLLSEHFVPSSRGQTGNFPQAYSHVGLINAAFAISPSWESIL